MGISTTNDSTNRRPLRLWPGIAAAVLMVLLLVVLPIVLPDAMMLSVMGSFLLALVIVLWWLFFSRAPWPDRVLAVLLMVIALFATTAIVHPSIRGGMMGMMLGIFAIPSMALGLVVCAAASRHLPATPRRVWMVVAILLSAGVWTLLRTDGITGGGSSQLAWRWSKTPEELLLAKTDAARPVSQPSGSGGTQTDADWPGFRGAARDSIVHDMRIGTDWAKTPPVELWRQPIGPGWSSFAAQGDLLYTQEQRGDDELVTCYKVSTGETVWQHRDAARFWESNAGAGPRGTPTLSNGRVYTFGATGIVDALDAKDGTVIWSRDVATETQVKVPGWGFSSSPLVVDDVVIVAISGALAGYDIANGEQRWFKKSEGGSYSSPHLMTIDGVNQILLMGGGGAMSVAPSDGKVLWEHAWPGVPIVQPAMIPGGDLLVTTAGPAGALGMRRISVGQGSGGWTVAERWTSTGLKPYFNDYVIHKGHAFGFDGFILACIDLSNGERKWKGGRYGNGQLVLFPDQDLLLVLSEQGELALVSAIPDQFTEVARFPAIQGKTWNHPAVAGDVLLVRNSQEMAAFRLPVEGR